MIRQVVDLSCLMGLVQNDWLCHELSDERNKFFSKCSPFEASVPESDFLRTACLNFVIIVISILPEKEGVSP